MGEEWFKIHDFVEYSKWPFDVDNDTIAAINSVLPNNYEYLHKSINDQRGFYLVEYCNK